MPSHLSRFKQDLIDLEGKDCWISIEKFRKFRSDRQNRALWLFFSILAEELNNSGYDMRTLIKKEVDISWTKNSIREYLWQPFQKAMFGEISTRKLTTEQINQIYDQINKVVAERTDGNIQVSFPSVETLTLEDFKN